MIMKTNQAKIKRRLQLLDDLLEYALRSPCLFEFCDGSRAPIRHMRTCIRCACIHRAIQMGLTDGTLEKFSAADLEKRVK